MKKVKIEYQFWSMTFEYEDSPEVVARMQEMADLER